MSTPISQCLVSKAAFGDEAAFKFLVEATEYNQTQVAYSYLPCECEPPCPQPIRPQLEELGRRVRAELERRRKEREAKYPPRPIGDFSKWIFPVIKNMPRTPWWKKIWNRLRGRPADDYDLRSILLAATGEKQTKTK